jgi:XapX domain-containing protein
VGLVELKAVAVGLVVGFLFARLNLPIPAPTALAGVLGIIGIYLGYRVSGLL